MKYSLRSLMIAVIVAPAFLTIAVWLVAWLLGEIFIHDLKLTL
jgi:hypothetical protein